MKHRGVLAPGRLRPLAALLIAGLVTLEIAIQVGVLPERMQAASADLLSVVLALVAGTVALLASRTASEMRVRKGWRLIAAGMFAWGAGDAIWSFYEVVLGVEAPFPSTAEVAYFAGYPLILAGILNLGMHSESSGRARTMLDALTFMLIIAVPVWFYVVLPVHQSQEMGLAERMVSNVYPVADLVLLFGVAVAALQRWGERSGLILLALGGGMTALLAADIAFSYLSQADAFETGMRVELGWDAGYALVALAAYLQMRWRPDYEKDAISPIAPAWRQLLPAAMLLPVIAWFAFVPAQSESAPDLVTATLLCVVVALTFVRSVMTLSEVIRLNASLATANEAIERSNESLRAKSRQVNAMLIEAVDLSRRDSLTDLLNHGAIMTELERAVLAGKPFHVALMDVDLMKAVNDALGHLAGDALLLALAGRLATLAHTTAGRYGGDEFLLIAPAAQFDKDSYEAYVRESLGDLRLPGDFGYGRIEVSIGFVSFPADGRDDKELLREADRRLYATKRVRRAAEANRAA